LHDPDVRPPFGDGGIWLVRPDGYLACSSSNAEDLANFLERLGCTTIEEAKRL
jgi:hypothetical protein